MRHGHGEKWLKILARLEELNGRVREEVNLEGLKVTLNEKKEIQLYQRMNLNALNVRHIDNEKVTAKSTYNLCADLKKLWDLDTLGIWENKHPIESQFVKDINLTRQQLWS